MNNQRLGDTFNLQHKRSVCAMVISSRLNRREILLVMMGYILVIWEQV